MRSNGLQISACLWYRTRAIMKKTLLFAAATVTAFFVLSEVILRLVLSPLPSPPLEWPPPDMTKHGLQEDDALFWRLRPGYDAPWRLHKLAYTHELAKDIAIDWKQRKRQAAPAYRGVTWQINEKGVRGDPVPVPKPPHIQRLLFIGSSVTFGWGVRAQRAFPERVAETLDGMFPHRAFDAVNAGVPGYSSYQGLLYMRELFSRYDPDIVIAEFGINDGTVAPVKQDKAWHPWAMDTLRKWLRNSGWRRLVVRIFDLDAEPEPMSMKAQDYEAAQKNFYRMSLTGEQTRVNPSDFRANLEKMADICRENDAVFAFFVPSLFNEYGKHRLIRSVDLVTDKAIAVRPALSAYPRERLSDLFLPYDEGHFSEKGHQVVAHAIVDYLNDYVLAPSR